jgi:hypothetical protein
MNTSIGDTRTSPQASPQPTKKKMRLLSSPENPRTHNMPKFLEFLSTQGATISPSVEFRQSKAFGLHVAANTTIPAGTHIFTLPIKLCITANTAKKHPVIGPILLRLQSISLLSANDFNRACIYSQLIYEAHLRSKSVFSTYISILPTMKELEERIATCNVQGNATSKKKLQLIGGTYISNVIVPKHLSLLVRIHNEVISVLERQLNEHGNTTNDTFFFPFHTLMWAAGIFHSRAIMIPSENRSSNERCEALVPLLDILNHRPGYLSDICRVHERKSGFSSSSSSSSSVTVKTNDDNNIMCYKVGRTIHANEQIFLNYGPKANEDLLSYFGFTLQNNICDVIHVVFPKQDLIDSDKFVNVDDGSKDHSRELDILSDVVISLYQGCLLKQVLNVARRYCWLYFSGEEKSLSISDVIDFSLRNKKCEISDVYNIDNSDDGDDSTATSRWFEEIMQEGEVETIDLTSIGRPLSRENEQISLNYLKSLITKSFPLVTDKDDNQSPFAADVVMYKHGQYEVAKSIIDRVSQLQEKLIPPPSSSSK